MAGNCWELSVKPYRVRSLRKSARLAQTSGEARKLLKGRYLCQASYCHRYRMGKTADSSTSHTGLRLVLDA